MGTIITEQKRQLRWVPREDKRRCAPGFKADGSPVYEICAHFLGPTPTQDNGWISENSPLTREGLTQDSFEINVSLLLGGLIRDSQKIRFQKIVSTVAFENITVTLMCTHIPHSKNFSTFLTVTPTHYCETPFLPTLWVRLNDPPRLLQNLCGFPVTACGPQVRRLSCLSKTPPTRTIF